MASCWPFLKREHTTPDHLSALHPWKPLYRRMAGKGENGGKSLLLASGRGLLIALHFRYKCTQALFINKYSTCLHQPPPSPKQYHLELPITLGSEATGRPSLGTKCWVGVAPVRAPFLSVIVAWRRLELLWEQFGLGWLHLVSILFFWITILPIPSCLPPSETCTITIQRLL